MTDTSPLWRFFTAGGFDQVRLDHGNDLLQLDQLDQKLWVALSCPTKGLEFDGKTLALVDQDQDGHVRAPELIAALRWTGERLNNPDLLSQDVSALPLAAIQTSHLAGAQLLAAARHVLAALGKEQAEALDLADLAAYAGKQASLPFNGDGQITRAATENPALQALIDDIVASCGAVADPSGQPGLTPALAEQFFTDAAGWLAWQSRPANEAGLLPLGAQTGEALAACQAVAAKIEDFFSRCRLAAFAPRAGALLNGSEEEFKQLAAKALTSEDPTLAALPLAQVGNEAVLPLGAGINPAWSAALARFQRLVVTPQLGERESLSAADWEQLRDSLAAYAAWQAAQPATPVAALGAERLQALLAGPLRGELNALFARDLALAPEAAAVAELEKLVRFTCHLGTLANNFVAFRDFYTGKAPAIFQAGTLYLDGRSCDLCLKVLDAGKHAALASLSGIYLAYCDCVRGSEKMTIAAAFTAGDSDQLMVGRNGVFYDREGRDWDATITRIVDHPISLRQAFWAPYKKVSRLVSEQLQKVAAAKSKSSDDLLANAVANAGKPEAKPAAKPAPAPAAAPAPSAFDAGKFAGIFAAVGLAIGAIGTAVASFVTGFLALKWWQMPVALVGLMLLISGPAMAMAWFKLRNRNLGPMLDANGWAVNTRARINIAFGTTLTQTAKLPEGAERALGDPYADKPTPWKTYVALGLAVLLILGYVASITGK